MIEFLGFMVVVSLVCNYILYSQVQNMGHAIVSLFMILKSQDKTMGETTSKILDELPEKP